MSHSPDSGGRHVLGPEPDRRPPMSTASRVLQACNSCHRRKTKCNGVRPTCGTCVLRRLPCSWPTTHQGLLPSGHHVISTQASTVNALESEGPPHKRLRPSGDNEGHDHLSTGLLQQALDIFYERHHTVEFCSFLHVPSLDTEILRRQSPFFSHALISLSALYMSKDEVVREGFATPAALSEWHATVARKYSRQSIDVPSIRSIQANLILALRELLTRTVYKAWIFTGIAIRQAQALRLGQEYHHRLSSRQKEIQRRTYWASFIMDRLVSYCCWRPQMIDIDNVRLNIPCPENIFTFGEPFEGHNLETLTLPYDVSRLGLVPYFIATLNIWSQATYIQVKGGRRRTRLRPSDPEGPFRHIERKVNDIYSSLPPTLQWSMHNRKIYRHTGQGRLFVSFHFLLHHARCVLHQEYLPYRDDANLTPGNGSFQDDYDETEAALDGRDERMVSNCLSSSGVIVDMVSELSRDDVSSRRDLQSAFAAVAMLSAANIQLWLQHVRAKDEESCENAATRVEKTAAVFESWRSQWPVAEAWASTLSSLRRLYQATYTSHIDPEHIRHESSGPVVGAATPPVLSENEAHDRPYPDLTEGNGLPMLSERMSDKIRFILLASLEDTNARERVLNSSMSTVRQDTWEYMGFPEDLELSFPELYADDSWSRFIDDYTVGDGATQALDLDQDASSG